LPRFEGRGGSLAMEAGAGVADDVKVADDVM
jgi:hypothetical protein